MEKAQVKFFPIKWFPPYVETVRLNELQLEFQHAFWLMAKESKDAYQLALRKQMLHNKLRDTLHLA